MKKQSLFVWGALLSGFLVSSCSEDQILSERESRDIVPLTTITATIGQNENSSLRSSLILDKDEDENLYFKNVWESEDSVGIRTGSGPGYYKLTIFSNQDNDINTFTYRSGDPVGVGEMLYAFYPTNRFFPLGNGGFTYPDTLIYDANNILPKNSWMMVASSDSGKFQFKNVNSLLIIKVKSEKGESRVKSIELKATSGSLSGSMYYSSTSFEGLLPYSPTRAYVVLKCGEEGVAINSEKETDFYIPIPAQTVKGLTVKVNLTDGTSYTDNPRDEKEFVASNYYTTHVVVKGAESALPEGALKGKFSVSATKQVYFSQGNLQYQASTGTWRFAENQYDVIGDDNKNISSTYEGWIDLFGWGTSGYNSKYPYMTSTTRSDYGDGSNDIAGTNYDWGVCNAISNGGNKAGMWRTLTKDEWKYLYSTRTNASDLHGQATVNEQAGYILLPDGWSTPSGLTFTANPNNFTTNSYSASEWSKMEAAGAVFLPCAGSRSSTDVYYVGSYGLYWSSTAYSDAYAYDFNFLSGSASVSSHSGRGSGFTVRLATE
ncbi:MAG: hypothetical protein MJZ34_07780 [Paludibacteraceae bacterium]|nr:hypothetical protein [Paludibacteraceae bacterium]